MDSCIKYFLKFGKREHIESFACGNMHFSNADILRGIEKDLCIKGQGDKLEGGSILNAQNMILSSTEIGIPNIKINNVNMTIHYAPASLHPIFCLFTCFDKDVVAFDEIEAYKICLSDSVKKMIREHFPDADAVAIINDPETFIEDVNNSMNTKCIGDLVNYFQQQSRDYIEYVCQDVPPEVINGKKKLRFKDTYAYRSLFCKDVFFRDEQEYRFVLPEENINDSIDIKIQLSKNIQVMSLNDFFKNN